MLRRLSDVSERLMSGRVALRAHSWWLVRRQLSIESAARFGNRSAERASPSAATPAVPSTLKDLRVRVLRRPRWLSAGAAGSAADAHACKARARAVRSVGGGLKE